MNDFSDINDRDDLHSIIWDIAKDATGVRPRWIDFDGSTIAELQSTATFYANMADEQMAREAEMEAEAITEYEELAAKTIEYGAGDRETAVRWIVQGFVAERYAQDVDCILYHWGLPFFPKGEHAHIKTELEAALVVAQEDLV